MTSHEDEHEEKQPAQAVQAEDSEVSKSPALTPTSFKAPTHFNSLQEQQDCFYGTPKSSSLSH